MKGGLIGLAAATVGLSNEAAQHLEVRGCSQVTWIYMQIYIFRPFIGFFYWFIIMDYYN